MSLFKVHLFVSGKFKGSVLAEARTRVEAFRKVQATALYKRLVLLGWMVQWDTEQMPDRFVNSEQDGKSGKSYG